MNIDPTTVTIQGDLSRKDVINLCLRCNDKNVVEFGMGGSTLLLARCCRSLVSFDTSPEWYATTQHRMAQVPDRTCSPTLTLEEGIPRDIPECDVLWLDGRPDLRKVWLTKFWEKASTVIVHDSRRLVDVSDVLDVITPHFESIKAIHINYDESNLLIVEKRDAPLVWENWNVTECKDNRADVTIQDFVA